jgi:hypothetical protein
MGPLGSGSPGVGSFTGGCRFGFTWKRFFAWFGRISAGISLWHEFHRLDAAPFRASPARG